MMKVTLKNSEAAMATDSGQARYDRRREAGSKQRYGRNADDHTVELEIEAIGAEMAVARVLNRTWEDQDTPDYDGDVGERVQVRHTRHTNGQLLLHPDDKDNHAFFLVTGTFPNYNVVGWLMGKQAKSVGEIKELQPGRPCVCVQQKDLRAPPNDRPVAPGLSERLRIEISLLAVRVMGESRHHLNREEVEGKLYRVVNELMETDHLPPITEKKRAKLERERNPRPPKRKTKPKEPDTDASAMF